MLEQSLEEIREYIDKRLKRRDVGWEFYRDYGQYMTEEQINKALDIGKDLGYLYINARYNFTPEQIDRALDIGEYLCILYMYVGENFTSEHIDKALKIGKDLWALYRYANKNFTSEHIDKALKIGKDLWALYEYVGHKFDSEKVEKAVEVSDGDELNILFDTLLRERVDMLEVIVSSISKKNTLMSRHIK